MESTAYASPLTSTRWSSVLLLVSAGTVAAVQVGKAVIAAPVLQADLGISLADIGWLTGIFALLGLIGGIPTGALAASFGSRRILLIGLLTTILGAACGAVATGLPALLLSRIIEGAGFLMITVAAPSLLAQVTERADRDFAFALWSCFMPAGIALAMLAGPLFESWRVLWWASGGLALLVYLLVWLIIPNSGERQAWSWRSLKANSITVLSARAPVVLAVMFALYGLMFFALFSFLPVLLMERMEVSHRSAGLLSALATAANILGNLAAGVLLSRGITRASLLVGASLTMGLTSLGIFLSLLPDTGTFMLCVVFSAVGGLIPAALLSAAPLVAPTAGLVPVVLGLIIQGNNLGQIIGPIAVGSAIQAFGWSSAAVLVAAASLVAVAVALTIGRNSQPARP
ncbi:MFS transporter [Pseudomonas sp. EA_35y_Pfl2_R111]|uniref:MFS transporter n=1 Tax=Pseudomonas sp. EA_35y_Pfl2_R111 TaxID=3088689 RepID=UPI0030D879FF